MPVFLTYHQDYVHADLIKPTLEMLEKGIYKGLQVSVVHHPFNYHGTTDHDTA